MSKMAKCGEACVRDTSLHDVTWRCVSNKKLVGDGYMNNFYADFINPVVLTIESPNSQSSHTHNINIIFWRVRYCQCMLYIKNIF